MMIAVSKAKADWSQIDWAKTQTKVTKLQNRIYEAAKNGNTVDVVRLQKTLISSYSARLIAVRRVTQDNQGKATAGVDGVKNVSPKDRLAMAEILNLDGKTSPLKRVEIPKPGKKEKKPVGIPTIMDRAKQALAKLALEPQWEALFEPNSYGFRPGRSCHDAIQAIELSIRRKAKYVLDADLKGCFDNIDQETLIRKLETFPMMENQIRAWLKAGVMTGDVFYETQSGTPQGGVISPLLANIALHGFETHISNKFPKVKTRKGQAKGKMKEVSEARVIRYADDFIILHEKLEVIQEIKTETEKWMAGIGLKLNEATTRITHTIQSVNEEKPGFDFLGFHIQTYEVGKTKSGLNSNGEHLMQRTKIRPSKESVKQFRNQIKDILRRGQSMSPEEMLKRHNWYVRSWANYFKVGESSHETFSKLQNDLYQLYLAWGQKKFSQRGNGYITKKIFHKSKYSKWNFGWKEGNHVHLATTLYEFTFVKHIKIDGNRSPYDGDWMYWVKRRGTHPLCPKDIKIGLKQQEGKCHHCNEPFLTEDKIEVHHIDGNRENNRNNNKCLVHRHCHDEIHRRDARPVMMTPHLA
jgi:RNA-directed DNA polymerase